MRFKAALTIFCLLGLCFFGCQLPPRTLGEVIKQEQHSYVRDSYGEERDECFTDDDLAEFKQKNVPGSVAQRLRESRDFARIVLDLKAKPEAERRSLLLEGRKAFQPSWAEIGRISSDGQTLAGQEGQRILAATIVDLAEELLALPADGLQKKAGQ